ncbi:hypothetical protein JXA12_04435 [Candidatus Woesearchaeota archaeon]|nr:hypothetical protein [Candidatus Woesearchaeota archaeon]
MRTVTEGRAVIAVPDEENLTKKADVFYNPAMKSNRDLSILILLARGKEGLRVCDPLAGSGVRSLRFLKELPRGMISNLAVNDAKQGFPDLFGENAARSRASLERVAVTAREASKLLLDCEAQDYIDIDPFGSPNEFLDAACKRCRRGGLLAVTATDTAPLCGTYPRACKRKYWAIPRRDHLMHEYGLRILIRKCQLIAAQYGRALTPLFSYSKDHYFRVFFAVEEGKSRVDALLDQHAMVDGYGPLWRGPLWDVPLVERMLSLARERYPDQERFLALINEEAAAPSLGFHDVHVLCKGLGCEPPRHDAIMACLEEKGIRAARTHFSPTGIRAACDEEAVQEAIKEAAR